MRFEKNWEALKWVLLLLSELHEFGSNDTSSKIETETDSGQGRHDPIRLSTFIAIEECLDPVGFLDFNLVF